jgi:hypothetical protein
MKKLCLTIVLCLPLIFSQAQEENAAMKQAANNAVNPVAPVNKFQLQPNYYFYYGGGNQLCLMTRVISPFDGIFLPFIKPKNKKLYSITRVEIPVIGQTYGSGSELNATGLGDCTLSDVLAVKTSWGRFGAGVNFGFPTATPPVLGSGKWTVGIAGLIMYSKHPDYLLGLVVNQYFSYAGTPSLPSRNYLNLQPFISFFFNRGYFIMVNPICTMDWNAGAFTLPLAFGFGKAFAKNLSAFLMPEYILTGPTRRTMVIQFNLNAMF